MHGADGTLYVPFVGDINFSSKQRTKQMLRSNMGGQCWIFPVFPCRCTLCLSPYCSGLQGGELCESQPSSLPSGFCLDLGNRRRQQEIGEQEESDQDIPQAPFPNEAMVGSYFLNQKPHFCWVALSCSNRSLRVLITSPSTYLFRPKGTSGFPLWLPLPLLVSPNPAQIFIISPVIFPLTPVCSVPSTSCPP